MEGQEKIVNQESFEQYKIWTESLLEGLTKLEGKIDKISTPEEIMSVLGFGYEQYARIMDEVFKGSMAKMVTDLNEIINRVKPEAKIDYRDIPYELIEKVEEFRKSRDVNNLPTKADIVMAIDNVRNLVKAFN